MAQCAICGKRAQVGNNVSFSKRRTKRRFNANIQYKKIADGDRIVRKYVCTKCLKALNKT